MVTFIFGGGNVKLLAILGLAAIAIALTMAPVVYTLVERIEFFKVGIIMTPPGSRAGPAAVRPA